MEGWNDKKGRVGDPLVGQCSLLPPLCLETDFSPEFKLFGFEVQHSQKQMSSVKKIGDRKSVV